MCILVDGRIRVTEGRENTTDLAERRGRRNKEIIFKNASIIECAWEINDTQVDHAKGLNIVIPMYNLI